MTSPCFCGDRARPPVWTLRIPLPYLRKNIFFTATAILSVLSLSASELSAPSLLLAPHIVEQFLRFTFFNRWLLQPLGLMSDGFFSAFDSVSDGIADHLVLPVRDTFSTSPVLSS